MTKFLLSLGLAAAIAAASSAADVTKPAPGTPAVKSISALAVGPAGVLFLGDPQSATIFAVETGDTKATGKGDISIDGFDDKVASLLGVAKGDIAVSDVKVNPASGNVFVSVTRGKGPSATPVVLKLDRATGAMTEVSLKNVTFSQLSLPNPTKNERQKMQVITNMGFTDGKLIVAGLSNEEFASTLRTIPFPFTEANKGAGIEIFHGAHGKLETNAPVRTFTPYTMGGTNYLIAAYTCTPLVQIPMSSLTPGAKVKGKTIAELGNGNTPLDMVVYQKDGKDFILMSNTSRGVMKIPTAEFEKTEAISTPVRGGKGTAGVSYETVEALKGVVQLDKLDADHALVLMSGANKALSLKSIVLP